jgi:hypothetical protein
MGERMISSIFVATDGSNHADHGRCQSKFDYFTQKSESYFATIDFSGFFGSI